MSLILSSQVCSTSLPRALQGSDPCYHNRGDISICVGNVCGKNCCAFQGERPFPSCLKLLGVGSKEKQLCCL